MDYEYNCATSPNQRCAGLYLMDTAALPFFRKGALSGEIKLRHEMVVCKTPPEGDRVRVERYVVLCMQSTQNLKREARKPGNLLSPPQIAGKKKKRETCHYSGETAPASDLQWGYLVEHT